jgi:hypothetical protein
VIAEVTRRFRFRLAAGTGQQGGAQRWLLPSFEHGAIHS